MNVRTLLWIVYSIISCLVSVTGVELTFELPDNAKQCFYEDIQQNTTVTLEFQVREQRLDRNPHRSCLAEKGPTWCFYPYNHSPFYII